MRWRFAGCDADADGFEKHCLVDQQGYRSVERFAPQSGFPWIEDRQIVTAGIAANGNGMTIKRLDVVGEVSTGIDQNLLLYRSRRIREDAALPQGGCSSEARRVGKEGVSRGRSWRSQ